MPLPVRSRWRLVVLLLAGILVSGCSLVFDVAFSGPGSDGPEIETELAADAWVVVFYDADSNSAIEYMTALEATEYRADDALQAAGVGFIDGNEFGEDGYELYLPATTPRRSGRCSNRSSRTPRRAGTEWSSATGSRIPNRA